MSKLSEVLLLTLSKLKSMHYINENDESWMKFLTEAVDHNKNKISQLLQASPGIPE